MAGERILIVEHDPIRGKALELILDQIGEYEATLARMPLEAFRALRSGKFDLILTNTSLEEPDDGVKMVRVILLKFQTDAPSVIVITSSGDKLTFQRCVQMGVIGYILYPYDPPSLLKRIRTALEERREIVNTDTLQKNWKRALDRIFELPTLSPIYSRIKALSGSDSGASISAEEIEKVVSLDQAITSKVLRMANSAFYGFNRKITSIRDAVALMGFIAIRNAVLTAATFEALRNLREVEGFNRIEFWKHSIGCGTVASVIARRLRLDSDTAFVAGLLHDIGKVVLSGYFPEMFQTVLKKVRQDGRPIVEAEQQTIHLTHAEIGKYLAERWEFPSPLPGAIGHHHQPASARTEDRTFVYLVHVADSVCRSLYIGSGGDHHIPAIAPETFTYLKTDPDQIAGWLPEIQEEVKKAFSLLALV